MQQQNRTQQEILQNIKKMEEKQLKEEKQLLTAIEKNDLKKALFDVWDETYLKLIDIEQKEYGLVEDTFEFKLKDTGILTALENRNRIINNIVSNSTLTSYKKTLALDFLSIEYEKYFKQYGRKCKDYEKALDEQYLIDNHERITNEINEKIKEQQKRETKRNILIVIGVTVVTIAILLLSWAFKGVIIAILVLIMLCGKK